MFVKSYIKVTFRSRCPEDFLKAPQQQAATISMALKFNLSLRNYGGIFKSSTSETHTSDIFDDLHRQK